MKVLKWASALALTIVFTSPVYADITQISIGDVEARAGEPGELQKLTVDQLSPRINVRDDLTAGPPYTALNTAPIFDSGNFFSNVFLVEMYIPSLGGSGFCTGTLINQRTVLIAGHCVQNLADEAGVADGDLQPYIYTAPDALPDYLTFNAIEGSSHIVHSGYDRNAFFLGNDIALVSLAEPVSLSYRPGLTTGIPYVTLATSSPSTPFELATLVGYGQAGIGSNPGFRFDIKRRIATNEIDWVGPIDDVFISPPGVSELIFTDFADPTDIAGTDYFCALFWGPPSCTVTAMEGSTDNGDSGGPMFVSDGAGGYIQVGVTSGGGNACGMPQGGYCDVAFWTSVAAFDAWIQANSPLKEVSSVAGNGLWSNAAHWSGGVVPDNFDTPVAAITDFTNPASYFNVTIAAAGETTLTDAREIDSLLVAGSASRLTIAGAGDLFVWGTTTVVDGVVRVDGVLDAQWIDQYGGRVQGNGTIISAVDFYGNFGGTVAPGNSVGTLTVVGPYVQGSGGLLEVELGALVNDLLQVTGDASLDGTLHVLSNGADLPLVGSTYRILTTGGSVFGTFATLDDDLPGLLYVDSVIYGADYVDLLVGALSFCTAASGPVQTPVCNALDTHANLGTPGMAGALSNLAAIDSSLLPAALEALNPTRAHAQTMVGLMSGDLLRNQFTRRGNDLLGGGGGSGGVALFDISSTKLASLDPTADMLASAAAAALTDGENGGSSFDLPNGYGLYFAGDVALAETDQAGGIGKDDADVAAVTAGIDRNEGTGFIYGAALSFLQSTVSQNYGFGGNTSSEGAAFSVYGDMRRGRLYANGFLSAGFHSFDTERRLLIAPNTFATATGSTDASQFQIAAHGGYKLGEHRYTSFDLIGGVGYISLDIDGYSETGAGPLSAVLAGRTVDSLITQLGGELTLHPDVNDGQLLPVLRVIWNHEFMDDPLVIASGFAGGPATTFTTPGPDLGSDWATLGVGIKGRLNNGATFVFRYELDVGRDGQDRQELSAAARFAF